MFAEIVIAVLAYSAFIVILSDIGMWIDMAEGRGPKRDE